MKKIVTKILSAMLIAACILSISACFFDNMEAESISLIPLSREEYVYQAIEDEVEGDDADADEVEEVPVFEKGAPMPVIRVKVKFKGEAQERTLSVWRDDGYFFVNTYLGVKNLFDSSTPGVKTMTITSGKKSCEFRYKIVEN